MSEAFATLRTAVELFTWVAALVVNEVSPHSWHSKALGIAEQLVLAGSSSSPDPEPALQIGRKWKVHYPALL